jgi:hypothetical protein
LAKTIAKVENTNILVSKTLEEKIRDVEKKQQENEVGSRDYDRL